MIKKIIILLIIAAAIGGGWYKFYHKKEKVSPYVMEKVAKGSITASVTSTGTLNAVTMVLVGTQVSGRITNIYVDFNSVVKKGQLIAQIDPLTFEAQVLQAKANLGAAVAGVANARAALLLTEQTLKRKSELFKAGLCTQLDLDTAQSGRDVAAAQLDAAKASVNQTRAALTQAQTNLSYTKILSPVNGIVVSRNVDVGQTVAASLSAPTLFNIAQDLTDMQIDTNVAEADIGRVALGQKVDFTVDAYPDRTFHGAVTQIRKSPITVQNVVTYDVVIKVSNPDLKLMPGMTANTTIVIIKKDDIIMIPNAALRFKPASEQGARPQFKPGSAGFRERGKGKGPAVWIVENEKPKRVPVKIGINDDKYTELVSGGLKEGQELIISSTEKDKSKQGFQPPRMF